MIRCFKMIELLMLIYLFAIFGDDFSFVFTLYVTLDMLSIVLIGSVMVLMQPMLPRGF
jgi:hypothetical protein